MQWLSTTKTRIEEKKCNMFAMEDKRAKRPFKCFLWKILIQNMQNETMKFLEKCMNYITIILFYSKLFFNGKNWMLIPLFVLSANVA